MYEQLFPDGVSYRSEIKPDVGTEDGTNEHVVSSRPQDYMEDSDVPETFWWGDVKGINYLSWTVNQHLPQYCGSCWAQAALSAFADRVNVMTNNAFPRVAMSVQ